MNDQTLSILPYLDPGTSDGSGEHPREGQGGIREGVMLNNVCVVRCDGEGNNECVGKERCMVECSDVDSGFTDKRGV